MTAVPAVVRAYVLDEHRATVEAVLACADAVADRWTGEATTDRTAVVEPLEGLLARTDVRDRFPSLLAGAADAAGLALPANPVAAPPYVTVAATGPVLRATADEGRLVVSIRAFEVERGPVRYVRGPSDPDSALSVEFRTR